MASRRVSPTIQDIPADGFRTESEAAGGSESRSEPKEKS